jgi:hypothetical protein
LRAQVTASQRGKNSPRLAENVEDSDKPYHARSMGWAACLKRVFNIDITECEICQNLNVSIISCIINTVVIQKILAHLYKTHPISAQVALLPPLRAPPDDHYDEDFIVQRDIDFGA